MKEAIRNKIYPWPLSLHENFILGSISYDICAPFSLLQVDTVLDALQVFHTESDRQWKQT